ncbi:hypothetical protein BLNAU_1403 [Blattamonas nauphoetae]|uniref:Uncharacterized protein n=1 Tax=Blattamonas nauphoetae TaxID=2049346 RepID=A0ABQ9YJ92_9EUKA|nr:hypothetical protein BLNAU_1403 [Blattamonas nauphoetae]
MSTSSFTSASSIAGVLVEPLHNRRCHPRKLTSRLPSLLVGMTIVCGCHICRLSHKSFDWRLFLKHLRKTRHTRDSTDRPSAVLPNVDVGRFCVDCATAKARHSPDRRPRDVWMDIPADPQRPSARTMLSAAKRGVFRLS